MRRKIKISEYDLQKGAIHKALDITVPPPTNAAVAAPAPKVAAPVSHKKVRCSSDKKKLPLSPSTGRIVWPASADAVKRTAPPPITPKLLTEKKHWNLISFFCTHSR